MAGIFDDPQTAGIMQAAFAMLNASGPSRTPVSLGTVIGQGGMAGLKGYSDAQTARRSKLQADKLEADIELEKQLTNGGQGILAGADPDKMEAIGTTLALRGHAGGAALIGQAEKIRAKKQAADRLGAMQSGNVAIDPQEAQQGADYGTPAPEATNGLFAPYFASPFVGDQAKALQARLDKDKNANPDDYLKRLDALAAAHRAADEKEQQRLWQALNLPKSTVLIKDKNSPTGWSHKDTRSGEIIQGAPPPASAAAQTVNDVVPSHHKDLHGDDYLGTLPTGMAATVKAIAEGKLDPAKAASLRYGNREALMQRVMQYDPKYNQQRVNVYKDFTSGKSAQNITAMNTVVAHMGTVADLVDAQKNGNIQTVNSILNRARTEFGDPSINNTEIAVQAMGNELMRVFRQVNASQHEVEAWEKKFNAAKGSPAQMRDALKVGAELLKGRLEAVNDQWKRGMDTEQDFPILSDKSKTALARLGVVGKGVPLSEQPKAENAPRRRRYDRTTGTFK